MAKTSAKRSRWILIYQWFKRNAAMLAIGLAFATLALTAIGVTMEELKVREESRAKFKKATERRDAQAAVVGIAIDADCPLCADKCAISDWDLASDVIYESAQVLLLNMSPRIGNNGFIVLGRICAVLFVFVLGIQAIGQLMAESWQNLRLLYLWCRGGHHIVCGLGRVGWPLVKQLCDEGRSVVVIERAADNELIDNARELGVIVLDGDATDEKNFELAHLNQAAAVYLVTGSDEENIEAAVDVREAYKPKTERVPPFRCFVHIIDPALGDVLDASLRANDQKFQVQTFNVTRNTARQLIVKELTKIRPKEPDEVALYVLFGFGVMGQTLATHLAELAHFESCNRCRILILTDEPKEASKQFSARWGQFTAAAGHTVAETWDEIAFDPGADDWGSRLHHPADAYQVQGSDNHVAIEYACNAIFAPFPKSVADRTFLKAMHRLIGDDLPKPPVPKKVKPALIFCSEQDQDSYSTAVSFYRQYSQEFGYPRGTAPSALPLYVWLPRQEPLKKLLFGQKLPETGPAERRPIPITPFGSCTEELKLDDLRNPQEDLIGQFISGGYDKASGLLEPIQSAVAELEAAVKAGDGEAQAAAEKKIEQARKEASACPDSLLRVNRTEMAIKWAKDTEIMLNSNRMAAIHFEIKLACLGLKLVKTEKSVNPNKVEDKDKDREPLPENPAAVLTVAKIEHNRWVAERLLAGVSYGLRRRTKDETNDIPPRRTQMCTWDHLTTDARLKYTEDLKDFLQVKAIFANLDQIELKAVKILTPDPAA